MTLEALLRVEARHRAGPGAGDDVGRGPDGDGRALALARRALDGMARGGIHDQLAGGFARYAVDATWTVPHFEKMLYDNALLLRVYVHAWRLTGSPLHRSVAEGGRGVPPARPAHPRGRVSRPASTPTPTASRG